MIGVQKNQNDLPFARSNAILRAKLRLEQRGFPRIQMSLIVAITGASGLLFSFLMLHAGVTSMALRYPLALLAAYGVFLLLLWLWLRTSAKDYGDLIDLIPGPPDLMPSRSGDVAHAVAEGAAQSGTRAAHGSSDAPPLPDAGISLDVPGEFAIPIFVAVFAFGLALASLYVIYAAPMLFAEVLVDGALSYALYRRMREPGSPHWLASAARRTALPFLLTGIFLAATGHAMAAYAPEAHSIGQVLEHSAIAR